MSNHSWLVRSWAVAAVAAVLVLAEFALALVLAVAVADEGVAVQPNLTAALY